MRTSKILTLAAIGGGVLAAIKLLIARRKIRGRRPVMRMQRVSPDSPPTLTMEVLPHLREQNNEIIELLRERNELLRRAEATEADERNRF
jgi:hypothetical protein